MNERVILQTETAIDHAFRTGGDLATWQDEVAHYASGNSRLICAISTAMAAPLLYHVNAESGGFHFRGGSSSGKTTALVVAGSVWGGGGINGYKRSWRATSNGLEGVAAMHCDTLLVLDEIAEVSAAEVGSISYMLGNGSGKTRATKSGMARRAAEWRLLFLSSGEISVAAKMGEDGRGRRVAAGQQVRVVDIAADAGAGLGLFESLHGFESASAFADHMTRAAKAHYGHAARAFLRVLVERVDAVPATVRTLLDGFVKDHCPAGSDGQVMRVAARFGLIAAGGEMATRARILPWREGEAQDGAARCFKDWLAARGGVESAEETDAITAVRRFVEQHGSSRFEPIGELAARDHVGAPIDLRIANRVGFRRSRDAGGIEFIILPEAWRAEICAGMDPGFVAKTLAGRGYLSVGADGKHQIKTRLPGFPNPVRCYVVSPDILGEAD